MAPIFRIKNNSDNEEISKKLNKNISFLKSEFNFPENEDLIIREIYVKSLQKKAVIIFIDGITDVEKIDDHIIHPLTEDTSDNMSIKDIIKTKIIEETLKYHEVIDHLINGNTILLIDEYNKALVIATTKFQHRSIEKPISENVIKGPQEAFVESDSINRSLIRKRLRNKNLISQSITVGERSKNNVTLMYIKDLADSELVDEVTKRINEIQVDIVHSIETLEQHLEERSYSLVPSVLYTERPDRVSAFLMEGHVALLMDSSSDALILPVTFWSLFHTGEDMYQRWPYGNFIRIIRLFAIFAALLTPSIYVAISTFHTDMVPTDLLLAISATRERVPFPVVVEVFIMDAAFELLRESGVRIPTPIGPTIGIVGALILGQAAVQANIVSPILVIVIAITGLASFAIPDNSLSYMIRISRFAFLILSSTLGAFGLIVGITLSINYMVSCKSFGVPFLAPLAPHYASSKDTIFRPPIWKQWLRPKHVRPKDDVRKKRPRGRSNQ